MKKQLFFTVSMLVSFSALAQNKPLPSKQKTTVGATKMLKPGTLSTALNTLTINLENMEEWLCPKELLRGDREFNGHGPKIKSEVKLKINSDSTALIAEMYLWAQETAGDFSTTEGRWERKMYDAPYGKKIKRILTETASRTQFISPKGGTQLFGPGTDLAKAFYEFMAFTDVKSAVLANHGISPQNRSLATQLVKLFGDNGNEVVRVPAVEGGLVKFFHIVGDTGAEDISDDDNCNDDTRIVKIEFFPVRIELR